MRGRLPGGEPGILMHELVLLAASAGEVTGVTGSLFHTRVSSGDFTLFPHSIEDVARSWVNSHDPTGLLVEPNSFPPARAPVSTAAAHVPETLGTFPRLRIDRRRGWGGLDFEHTVKLERFGLDGWWWRSEPEVSDDVVAAVAGGPIGDWLRAQGEPGLLQILSREGELAIRRNGFLDAAGLDALAEGLSVVAPALRAVGLAHAEPQNWSAELPPPRWFTHADWEPGGYDPGIHFRQPVLRLAQRSGATLEDPRAYHRAFPALPVPGTAFAVLRRGDGTRLVLHNERDLTRTHLGPTAIVRPAASGEEPGGYPTPAGNNLFRNTRGNLSATMRTRNFAFEGSTEALGYALIEDVERFLVDAGG
jgi:hypothetical protein